MLQLSELPIGTFKEIATDSLNEIIGCLSNSKEENHQHVLPKQELEELVNLFKSIFTQLSYSIITQEDLTTILDNERARFITDCYLNNKYHLATALLMEHNAEVQRVLDNFDWKVKWIVGSSVSTVLRYPLLQLDLSVTKHSNNKIVNNIISLEMNKTDLDRFINEIENAIKSL